MAATRPVHGVVSSKLAITWRAIADGFQAAHDAAPPEAQGRYAAMIATYRAESDYLNSLILPAVREYEAEQRSA